MSGMRFKLLLIVFTVLPGFIFPDIYGAIYAYYSTSKEPEGILRYDNKETERPSSSKNLDLLVIYDNLDTPSKQKANELILFSHSDHFVPVDSIDFNIHIYPLLYERNDSKKSINDLVYADMAMYLLLRDYEQLQQQSRLLLDELSAPYYGEGYQLQGKGNNHRAAVFGKKVGAAKPDELSINTVLKRLKRQARSHNGRLGGHREKLGANPLQASNVRDKHRMHINTRPNSDIHFSAEGRAGLPDSEQGRRWASNRPLDARFLQNKRVAPSDDTETHNQPGPNEKIEPPDSEDDECRAEKDNKYLAKTPSGSKKKQSDNADNKDYSDLRKKHSGKTPDSPKQKQPRNAEHGDSSDSSDSGRKHSGKKTDIPEQKRSYNAENEDSSDSGRKYSGKKTDIPEQRRSYNAENKDSSDSGKKYSGKKTGNPEQKQSDPAKNKKLAGREVPEITDFKPGGFIGSFVFDTVGYIYDNKIEAAICFFIIYILLQFVALIFKR